MPKVKMLKTVVGSLDGVNVKQFIEGEAYEISESLAKDFSSLGAITVCEHEAEEAKEKAEVAAPKNKAYKQAPKNKQVLGGNNNE